MCWAGFLNVPHLSLPLSLPEEPAFSLGCTPLASPHRHLLRLPCLVPPWWPTYLLSSVTLLYAFTDADLSFLPSPRPRPLLVLSPVAPSLWELLEPFFRQVFSGDISWWPMRGILEVSTLCKRVHDNKQACGPILAIFKLHLFGSKEHGP